MTLFASRFQTLDSPPSTAFYVTPDTVLRENLHGKSGGSNWARPRQ